MINKKSCLKVFILLILSLLIITTVSNYSYASGDAISNPDYYKPGGITTADTDAVTQKVNRIVGAIVTLGTVTSVITVIILGIKYMLGTLEEKADYKKSMLPYLIGAVLLFASSTVVSIIAKLVQGTGLAK